MDTFLITLSSESAVLKTREKTRIVNFSGGVGATAQKLKLQTAISELVGDNPSTQCVLLLSSEFIGHCHFQHAGTKHAQTFDTQRKPLIHNELIVNPQNVSDFCFSDRIYFSVDGKNTDSYDELAVLQPFTQHHEKTVVSSDFVFSFISFLQGQGLRVAGVTSMNVLSGRSSHGRSLFVQIQRRASVLSLFCDGVMKAKIIVPQGLQNIIDRVAGTFALTPQMADMLVRKLGYITPPQKYMHSIIDLRPDKSSTQVIPVKMSDLSANIKSEFHRLVSHLYTSIYELIPDFSDDYTVTCSYDKQYLKDGHLMLQDAFGRDVSCVDAAGVDYDALQARISALLDVERAKNSVSEPTDNVERRKPESSQLHILLKIKKLGLKVKDNVIRYLNDFQSDLTLDDGRQPVQ